jgi:hypothetical protein
VGGGCGGGGGGSGANPTTLGTNGGGGAGAAGCVYLAFTGSITGSPAITAFTPPTCYSGSYSSSMSFSSVAMEAGVLVLAISDGVNAYPSAVVINGHSATLVGETISGADNGYALWSVVNPSGTSGTITFTVVGGSNQVCIALEGMTNLNSSVPACAGSCPTAEGTGTADGSGAPRSLGSSLTVSSGGFGVLMFSNVDQQATTPLPFTWANATGDTTTATYFTTEFQMSLEMAHMTATGTPTAYCTGTTCDFADYGLVGGNWR